MQSFHVQINARSDRDLDEATVLKKVADAGGAKYSVHEKKAGPPPTVWQKLSQAGLPVACSHAHMPQTPAALRTDAHRLPSPRRRHRRQLHRARL